MSSKTIRIRPKPGVQLAGIPAEGAEVDLELANEWLDAGLVTRVSKPKPAPKTGGDAK